MSVQVKSKKRVNDFGEVYTAEREVNAMLDLVSEQASSITATFLEPACGNGNFVSAILKRKLKTVRDTNSASTDSSLNILRAVSSIYGVDIQSDNVFETRARLREQAVCAYDDLVNENGHARRLWMKMLDMILSVNIVCGNTLTAMRSDGTDLLFSEWQISENGDITRDEVRYSDMLNGTDNESDRHTVYNYTLLLRKLAA